jgi:hypothetical protein
MKYLCALRGYVKLNKPSIHICVYIYIYVYMHMDRIHLALVNKQIIKLNS